MQLHHTREQVVEGDAWVFSTGTIVILAKKKIEDGFNFEKAC